MTRWFGFLLLLASLGVYFVNGTSDPPPDDPPPVPGDGLPFPTPDPSGSPVAQIPGAQ
jgi:hypothetical protein